MNILDKFLTLIGFKNNLANEEGDAEKLSFLYKMAKIENLPQNVRDSLPFRGFSSNGIIETSPGAFTKSYRLEDVNFNIAPVDEQTAIFKNYMDFINSFNENVMWQYCIFNHEIDKKTTIDNIRIRPQKDGLNYFRQEVNGILLSSLKSGNNSIAQEKFLTLSIKDKNAEHAAIVLDRLDAEVSKKLRRITKKDTVPMTTHERMKILYDIYNQDSDYRMLTGIYDGNEEFNLTYLGKCGLSVKDVIGPSSMKFDADKFMLGDMYGRAMYLERVPAYLSTNFISDLSDIQNNLLISVTSEALNPEAAIKMVKGQIANIEARVSTVQKRNSENGYFGDLPPELEHSRQSARELMNDIVGRNQNLFYVSVTVVIFAHTLEELEEVTKMVKSVSGKHLCPIKTMRYQQEFAFNTALPLARNDLYIDRLYTTESASVFIPYNAQELNQRNAIFYGLNQSTKGMILSDRLTGSNYNGLIFGGPGSGKSFIAKWEMACVLLNRPNSQIFVIDPQGEYYPLAKVFNGQEIVLAAGSNVYINPLDLDISETGEADIDPITMKSDFIISMFDIIIGKGRELDPIHTSIIDKCVRKIYRPYIEELRREKVSCNLSKCPSLSDLYQEFVMLKHEKPEAGHLADILYQYAVGSFDIFAHRTNVNTNARFVVYNTSRLGSGIMKNLSLHICVSDVLNRMILNSKRAIYTWLYIDEFHVLLESDLITSFLKKIWKMARKWLGVPTGIMQNTEDLLRNPDARAIINTTFFVIMLKEPVMDRQNLAELFKLSNAQLEHITESDPGHGLIYNGKVTLPFNLNIPKETQLYKAFTTAHDVQDAMFA